MLVHNNGVCDVNFKKLFKEAEKEYPKKAGKLEDHHVDPKYMGGPKNGITSKIPAPYHQKITNAFRDLHKYGKGKLSQDERNRIMKKVYSKLPLPK